MKEKSPSPWKEKITNILLAGLGAAVVAEEELVKFIREAVQKGALGKGEGEELLKELLKKKKKTSIPSDPVLFEETLREKIRLRLKELNLPTRRDILELNRLLEALLQKMQTPT